MADDKGDHFAVSIPTPTPRQPYWPLPPSGAAPSEPGSPPGHAARADGRHRRLSRRSSTVFIIKPEPAQPADSGFSFSAQQQFPQLYSSSLGRASLDPGGAGSQQITEDSAAAEPLLPRPRCGCCCPQLGLIVWIQLRMPRLHQLSRWGNGVLLFVKSRADEWATRLKCGAVIVSTR